MVKYTVDPTNETLQYKYSFEYVNINDQIVYDSGPRGNHAAITKGSPAHVVEPAVGAKGQGLLFDNLSYDFDHSTGLDADLPEKNEDFTLFIRFKPKEEGGYLVTTTPNGFDIRITNGDLLSVTVDDVSTSSFGLGLDFDDGEFHWAAISVSPVSDTQQQVTVMADGLVLDQQTADVSDMTHDAGMNIVSGASGEENFECVLDEIRMYTRGLTVDEIEDVASLAEHRQVDNIGDVWPTPGMPYIKGEPNAEFAGVLGTTRDHAYEILDALWDGRFVDTAGGQLLDRFGELVGVRRRTGESDESYRCRIKATAIAGRSSGTFPDILNSIVTLLNTEPENIVIQRTPRGDEVIEDFERTNPLDEYDDETGTYTVTTTEQFHGGRAIGVDPSTDGDSYQSIHRSEAGISPTQGDEFNWWVRPSANPDSGTADQVAFRWAHNGLPTAGSDDGYWLIWTVDDDNLTLKKGPFGSETDIASQTNVIDGSSYPNNDVAGSWFRINVKWDDGNTFGGSAGDFTITMYANDGDQIVQFTANDTDFDGTTNTGIGWITYIDSAIAEPTWMDYVYKEFGGVRPGSIDVFTPSGPLEDAGCQDADYAAFVEDLILAGHNANVYEGSPPFTLYDGGVREPELGLTTDDEEGGYLTREL